jgi:glycine/D-amino acid oxidase-like deaminating enzyme/nitrite reductase/ring-hydroxylating ferredoxin subunit
MPATRPIWGESVETRPLESDAQCDVCVVGAGIAGLLIAERLAGYGQRVIVLDAGPVAGGETGRTTAHFVTALDDRYMHLERVHGKEGARTIAASHAAAIDHVEAVADRVGIPCGWSRLEGFLTVNPKHADRAEELLEKELGACERAGVSACRVDRLPLSWPDAGPAIAYSRQAQFHPLDFAQGVARYLGRTGIGIHTGTKVKHVHGGKDAAVETERGPVVRCGHIVVATNTPINNLVAVHTKQSGYQTYVLAFGIPAGALPSILWWDGLWEDDTWYHYVRVFRRADGHECLIVGGEDHKTGQGPHGDPFAALEEWTRSWFPMCGEIEARWSGEVMEPADGLAYIGHNAVGRQNVYIVTGDSGNGMTHGAVAALLIPDLIMGRDHPWESLYSPARKIGVHSLKDYLYENVNTAAQYADWLRRGDVASEDDIPAGTGAIMTHGLKHIAVYKDSDGRCTRLNACCTHLGGVVRWNALEKTWDCPCHASRFDLSGHVVHGPANSPLVREA